MEDLNMMISKIAKLSVLLISLLFLFAILIQAQGQSYDPVKELPFDKSEILKTLKEIVKQKESVGANIYIIDNFLKTGRYQAGIFALQSLKTIPGYEERAYSEKPLCLCYVFSGEISKGMKCLWEFFLTNNYPNIDFNQMSPEKKAKIEREFDLHMILSYLGQNNWFDEEQIESLMLKKIDEFFKKYPNPTADESEYLNKRKKMILDYQALKKKLSQRKTMRRKQILDCIHELEKLLVERDEIRLSEFFNKYSLPDRKESLMRRFTNQYFKKNYTNIHFELIADSKGECINLTGFEEEIADVDYIVKTIPESKGKDCPVISYSETEGDLYCQGFFKFKFKNNKIFVD